MGLSVEDTRALLIAVADSVVAAKDMLTEADSAIGDGDHGIGMAVGFEAAKKEIEGKDFADVGAVWKAAGMGIMKTSGGACGAVFSTLFRSAGKSLGAADTLETPALAAALAEAVDAIKARGGANLGDKTMLDALAPAADALAAQGDAPLPAALAAAAAAAEAGVEATKQMVAKTGKARPLGERSLGHADPGAVSTAVIFRAMRDHLAGQG
ncbi:MAG: dihydroxyacetone kinase subunit L [Rhodospirillaceae bacterium]|nr:dihydroxyacetone kinase subunit L [Rhodospirillaceae bacterium]